MSRRSHTYLAERTKRVLQAVPYEREISAGELAQTLGIERHNLSPTLTRLVRRGQIVRTSHGHYTRVDFPLTPAQACACQCCDHNLVSGSSGSS